MQKINFIKMHGLGNDFVIIDKRNNNIKITKELISKLSDRKSGAGCDQLITINSNNEKNIEVSIDIFNPTGDKAEACGNGTRCVAKLLFSEFNKSEINIRTIVNLPGGTGKKIKVAVVCEDTKSDEAKSAGADIVGGD